MDAKEAFWSSEEGHLEHTNKEADSGIFEVERLKELDELHKEKRALLNQVVSQKEEHFVQEKRIREQNKEISKLNITISDFQRRNK